MHNDAFRAYFVVSQYHQFMVKTNILTIKIFPLKTQLSGTGSLTLANSPIIIYDSLAHVVSYSYSRIYQFAFIGTFIMQISVCILCDYV
jgi:hypothetical protein